MPSLFTSPFASCEEDLPLSLVNWASGWHRKGSSGTRGLLAISLCAILLSWRRTQTRAHPGGVRLWNRGRQGDPTGLYGELRASSRLIHGGSLSALGEDMEPPFRSKPAAAHVLTWDKNWNLLLEGPEDSVRPGSRASQTCLRQGLGEGLCSSPSHPASPLHRWTQPNTALCTGAGHGSEWGLPLGRKHARKGSGCLSLPLYPL